MKLKLYNLLIVLLIGLNGMAQINTREPFKSELKNVQIVLLGEPTHGEGNVFTYKTELIKYLHDSLDFEIIAFESGLYDLHQAQVNINQNPNVRAKEYIKEALFPIWYYSTDFQPFLDYFEDNKHKLQIAGFDNQLTGRYSKENLLSNIKLKLRPTESDKINFNLLKNAFAHFEEFYTFPTDVSYASFEIEINKILKGLASSGQQSIENQWEFIAINNIKVLAKDYYSKKDLDINATTWKVSYSNTRDSMMAQNIIQLTKLYPNKKIICWGASTHLMGDPTYTDNIGIQDYKPAGLYLKKYFKKKLKSIAFISPEGEYGIFGRNNILKIKDTSSIELAISDALRESNQDSIIVLKNTRWANRSFVSFCLENTSMKAKWSNIFDIFIYLPKYTPNEHIGFEDEESELQTPLLTHLIKIKILDVANDKPIANAQFNMGKIDNFYQSDMQGNIELDNDKMNSTIELISSEYQTQKVLINKPDGITVYLKKKKYTLPTVDINAKRINVKKIIKNVEDNLVKNYPTQEFQQPFIQKKYITNFDTVVFDIDGVVDTYPLTKNTAVVKNLNYKGVRYNKTSTYDAIGKEKYSVYRHFNNSGNDLTPLVNLKKKLRRNYRFELNQVIDDSTWGLLYIIDFEQKWMNNIVAGTELTLEHKGTLYIREKDWAIIKSEHQYKRDLNKLNKWLKKYGGKKSKVGNGVWSTNKIKSEIITAQEKYFYDTITAKYYILEAVNNEHETGSFPDQEYDVIKKTTFKSIGLPSSILPKENYRKYKYYMYEAKYDKTFWRMIDALYNF